VRGDAVNTPDCFPFNVDAFGIGVLLQVLWVASPLWMPFVALGVLIGLWIPRRRSR